MGTPVDEAVLPAVLDFAGFDLAGAGVAAEGASLAADIGAAGTAVSGVSGLGNVLGTLKTASSILSPVASLAASASSIAAAKRAGAMSTMPKVTPSTPIPAFGSPTVTQAQQSSFQEQLRRRGRASTILTAPQDLGEKLGA